MKNRCWSMTQINHRREMEFSSISHCARRTACDNANAMCQLMELIGNEGYGRAEPVQK